MNIVLQILSVYYYKEQVFPSIMESKNKFSVQTTCDYYYILPKTKMSGNLFLSGTSFGRILR